MMTNSKGDQRIEISKFLLLILLLGFSNLGSSQSCQFTTFPWYGDVLYCDEFEPWQMILNEEFDDDLQYRENWINYYPYTNDGSDNCNFCRTHGNEAQVYLDENAEIRDGKLILIAKRGETEWMGELRPFSSGMVHSRIQYRFGKFEIRCKLPSSRGFVPAFWLFGGDELDIFEVCTNELDRLNSNLHMKCNGESIQDPKGHSTEDLSQEFHTIAAEWNPKFVEWSIDGEIIRRTNRFQTVSGQIVSCGSELAAGVLVNNNLIPDEFMNVIINLTVIAENGSYCEDFHANAETPDESEFIIDYVKIFQKNGGNKQREISVYPNPTQGLLVLELNTELRIDQAFIFNDITGMKRPIDLRGAERSINLKGMASGRYHVEVHFTSGEIAITSPFIIIEN